MAVALALAAAAGGGCQAAPTSERAGGPSSRLAAAPAASEPLPGPLAALPPQIKASDFRVTPPPVETIHARAAADGRAIVDVQMGADPRLRGAATLTLMPSGQPWVLRDDGTDGDRKAGDGIFSIVTPFDYASLLAEQKALRLQLTRLQIKTIQRFRGLSVVGEDQIAALTDGLGLRLLHSLPITVDPHRSLTVTAVSVVEDPTRTGRPCTGAGTPLGRWSFGHLMTEMADTAPPAAFVRQFFDLLETGDAAPNGEVTPGMRGVAGQVITPWPKLPDGSLDLTRAPLKLIAIVNRIDLAGNTAYGAVGGAEGRFIFEAMDPSDSLCRPLGSLGSDPIGGFFLIVEYGVPINDCVSLRDWANRWAALSDLPLGSAEYNSALEALTETFVRRGADLTKANGSALNQIRVNEIAINGAWQLQQIRLIPGRFRGANVSQTPRQALDTATPDVLAGWVNAHASSILLHTHTVPATLSGAPFLGAIARNDPPSDWRIAGAVSNDVRHAFSLDTCNGCHGLDTGTFFVHVGGQFGVNVGGEAELSHFLTGETIPDPEDGTPRTFNELARRASVLENIASSACFMAPKDLVPKRPTHLPIPALDVQPNIQGH